MANLELSFFSQYRQTAYFFAIRGWPFKSGIPDMETEFNPEGQIFSMRKFKDFSEAQP